MFNLFSILLLLIAVLQIVKAIEIWVKPSVLRYTAEIICLNSDGPITIGTATHSRIFGELGTTGYVNIGTDLSRCEDVNPNVKVRIKKLDSYELMEFEIPKTELSARRTAVVLNNVLFKMEFEIPKAELSARKSAVVLGFNIEPSARKQFYFQQSSSILRVFQRPLVNYELEIECDYQPSWTQYIVFGSEVQKHGQNGINIPIYEIEMLEFCSRGRIGLNIYNAERERTYIDVTREFLLENDAFNINMANKTVQPIHNGALKMLEEIEPKMMTMYL